MLTLKSDCFIFKERTIQKKRKINFQKIVFAFTIAPINMFKKSKRLKMIKYKCHKALNVIKFRQHLSKHLIKIINVI